MGSSYHIVSLDPHSTQTICPPPNFVSSFPLSPLGSCYDYLIALLCFSLAIIAPQIDLIGYDTATVQSLRFSLNLNKVILNFIKKGFSVDNRVNECGWIGSGVRAH